MHCIHRRHGEVLNALLHFVRPGLPVVPWSTVRVAGVDIDSLDPKSTLTGRTRKKRNDENPRRQRSEVHRYTYIVDG